jgi:hypothetical protein
MENIQDTRTFEVVTTDLGEFILMDLGNGQKAGVPKDLANSDYQAYLKQAEQSTPIVAAE